MLVGKASTHAPLSESDVLELLARGLAPLALDGKRVLVIIPDSTRTAPIPLLFRQLYALLGDRVARLDYLIALGTHPPMSEAAIERLVGVSAAERAARYPRVAIFNHRWDRPDALTLIGTIGRDETAQLTDGLLADDVPVVLNRLIFDYDHLIICGPVFPHEVVGFSGGAKYLFPGIAGAEIINFTHWLGALVTSMDTIGVKDTPVRRVIHRAAAFVRRPILLLALVLKGATLHGLYIGDYQQAWSAAADLSAQLNVITVARPFRRVLSMPAPIYDDLWTAAKAMYKTEPAVADGGEIIIYAPHITEISYTHGRLIDAIGYHVRDYFLKQWDRFRHVPGGILAHSTHVKGKGSYDAASGIETPRIQVTLATGIPEERCRRVNLGYVDPRTIDPRAWAGREAEGILLVPHAGEMLYRCPALRAAHKP
ncbi:lactate racemase domain-containing protein [Kallotenue papyrolyticum]|uniref:lactate racemase domain-containing protein n=1 Tax=Kallotenue papyrolyticum TaxID=1325125 RepID=UPI0004785A6A|nr:lactate racemase domain-containing protein [Kallotenue papyrolyticum]